MNAEKRDFDQEAREWDAFAPRVRLMSAISDRMMEQVELSPDIDVLDFGAGTGLVSLPMAGRVKSLTGADTSKGMLGVLAGKAEGQQLSNVRTLLLDPESEAPLEGEYDLIVSSMVFHHIENIRAVLARLQAALKPEGTICIADLDPDDGLFHGDPVGVFHDGFEREGFAESLKQAGFEAVEVVTAVEFSKPVGDEMKKFSVFLACGRK